jgi:hypothetical protein
VGNIVSINNLLDNADNDHSILRNNHHFLYINAIKIALSFSFISAILSYRSSIVTVSDNHNADNDKVINSHHFSAKFIAISLTDIISKEISPNINQIEFLPHSNNKGIISFNCNS